MLWLGGVYELRLNSQRVGNHLLAPEWTSYHHRFQYQTYDVTPLVREGQNAMGAILAAGWCSSRIGLVPRRRVYGPFPQLLLRLDVELRSGMTVSVVNNDSWQKASGVPLKSSYILDGEIYDALKEMKGWDSWGFQAKGWQSVETDADLGATKLVCQPNEAIRIVKEINPIDRTQPKPNIAIFDLGQNIVGWCRLRVRGKAGDVSTASYAEMLNEDDTLYIANLRGAPATERFVLNGEREVTLEWGNAP
jgi:alpha-L-rhamnosidase